jgi:hypothetical protein
LKYNLNGVTASRETATERMMDIRRIERVIGGIELHMSLTSGIFLTFKFNN